MQSYIGVKDNFLLESGYLVARLEEIVMAAQDTRRFTEEQIGEMFRVTHTMKSAAGIMLYDHISILAHRLEDVFYYLRETYPETVPHEELVEGILSTADFITAELVKIQTGQPADGNADGIIAFLKRFLETVKEDIRREGENLPPKQRYTAPAYFYVAPKADEIKYYRISMYYRIGTEMSNVRAYAAIHALGDAAEKIIYSPEKIAADPDTAGAIMRDGFHILLRSGRSAEEIYRLIEGSSGEKEIQIQDSSVEEFLLGFQETGGDSLLIRLDDDWLEEQKKEELIPGDYVIRKETGKGKVLQGKLSRLEQPQDVVTIPVEKLESLSGLVEGLDGYRETAGELGNLIDGIREIVLSMKKISMRGIFHKMDRAVYDISRKLNKLVDFTTEGEETEIDRNLMELLSDCLIHILRNAVDHGIEDKRERLNRGKTAKGNIMLQAGRRKDEIYVSVSDDGRGLDADRIFEMADGSGLLKGKERGDFTNEDIYQLIMLPGFSTNRQVTEYSGRGVGLDVVVRNVELLRGRIEVDSIPGQGTEMVICFPG